MTQSSLRRQAKEAARHRGHRLRKFQSPEDVKRPRQTVECVLCKRTVTVILYPMPNEAQIMGEAVAVSCTGWFIQDKLT